MTLPIRRLPILVIHLILQTMGFLDLFLMTRTSTKMKRIVQNMIRTQKHYLFVTIGEDIEIQIQSMTNLEHAESIDVQPEEDKPRKRFLFNMRVGSVDRLPSAYWVDNDGGRNLCTYWIDMRIGCIALCNELVEVFRTPVRGVILNLQEVDNYQNEINWVNATFPGLIVFLINGECSFQDYMWIIRNTRATEEIRFNMVPTEYPDDLANLEIVPFDSEFIMIEHGGWVSLQQLQAIKSNFIGIKDVQITDSQFNEFFKNLKISKKNQTLKN